MGLEILLAIRDMKQARLGMADGFIANSAMKIEVILLHAEIDSLNKSIAALKASKTDA